MACRFLVEEVSELMAMLDPKTHSMLYEDFEEEKVDVMKGKGPAQVHKNMKARGPRSSKETAAVKREDDVAPAHFPPSDLFGQSSEGSRQENGGTDWAEQQSGEQQTGVGDDWGLAGS
jgi:hypothetical protein